MHSIFLSPFALSLSKGAPERSEGILLHSMKGFDKLSPNGFGKMEAAHG